MRLNDLGPKFCRIAGSVSVEVDTLAEAQGIRFLCPACGTHQVLCWSRSRGVPDDAASGPGRWLMRGTGFDDLTLDADPPGVARSVLLTSGCRWHGFVTDGEVT